MKLIVKTPFVFLVLYLTGCAGAPEKGHIVQNKIKQADSVDIIYYDVAGSDEIFKFISLADSSFMQTLVEDITREPLHERDCLKDGKIYCYRNGALFNTIYFSFGDKQCLQLSYIHNAMLYVFPMSNDLFKDIQQYKDDARPPLVKYTALQVRNDLMFK